MRIDFLSNHGLMGGGEVMLFQLAGVARELGHTSVVIAPEDSEVAERARSLALPFVGVEAKGRRQLMRRYHAYSRASDADVLWCNGPVPSMATIGVRTRRIVHLHQHPTGSQATLLRLARRSAAATLVPSHTMAAMVKGTTAFPNWTDAPPPDFTRRIQDSAAVRIGFIGRISTVKGLDVLADSVALLPSNLKVRLIVAGDDRFVPAAESAPVRAALERISGVTEVVGWTNRDSFHASIDLLVVPSTWDEPFGLVAAEAMARRTPLLVTKSGALPEIVGPDHPWIVRRRDPEALAAAMAEMIADPERVRESVIRAENRWNTHFSPGAGTERLTQFLSAFGDQRPEAV
jgi:glycosyltransferase involved in cell wall biosynthesis